MSDIQKAREVLAEWRERANKWTYAGDFAVIGEDPTDIFSAFHTQWKSNARLIVGTAGNPELLDAIDVCLEVGADYADLFEGALPPTGAPGRVLAHANRIAAAILSADEPMRS